MLYLLLLSSFLSSVIPGEVTDARAYRGKGNVKYATQSTLFLKYYIEFEDDRFNTHENENRDHLFSSYLKAIKAIENLAKLNGNLKSYYTEMGSKIHEYPVLVKNKSVIKDKRFPFNVIPRKEVDSIVSSLNDKKKPTSLYNKGYRNLAIIYFVKAEGRSYTVTAHKNDALEYTIYFTDGTLRYFRPYANLGMEILHELLHQFGAMDLYYPFGKSDKDKSSNLEFIRLFGLPPLVTGDSFNIYDAFRDSVMKRHMTTDDDCLVSTICDPVTLYLIGYSKKLDKRFHRLLNMKG